MEPELVISAMLSDASLTDLIGNRMATPHLPTNTSYPALVYQLISNVPQPIIDVAVQQFTRARFQITPLATDIGTMKQIHGVVRALLDHKIGVTAAGKKVVYCRLDSLQPIQYDQDLGLWHQAADYLLTYYE